MRKKIICQSIWTSPDGKIKVVTTPEAIPNTDLNVRFHIYNLALHQYFTLGAEVDGDYVDAKNKAGKDIKRVENVFVNNESVLKQETAKEPGGLLPSGPDVGMCIKEIGEALRSGQIAQDWPKYIKQIRLVYWTHIFKTLGIKLADEE